MQETGGMKIENIVELTRRLENLVRIGTVVEVDTKQNPPVCRVQTGEITTDWRPWVAQRAGSARKWWAPTKDEQVILVSPSGDLASAMVFCSLYSAQNPPPDDHETRDRTIYPDGTVIEYDPEAHQLKADLNSSSLIMNRDKVVIESNGSSIELSASGIKLNGSRIDLN